MASQVFIEGNLELNLIRSYAFEFDQCPPDPELHFAVLNNTEPGFKTSGLTSVRDGRSRIASYGHETRCRNAYARG